MINKKIISILSKVLNIEREFIQIEHHLINDLNIDSFELVEIAYEIKLEYKIGDLRIEEIISLETVLDIIKLVKRKIKGLNFKFNYY